MNNNILSIALCAVTALLLGTVGSSSVIAPRAITCEEMLPVLEANRATATRFCNVYLQIAPETTTAWSTATYETRTFTTANYTTTTIEITPSTTTERALTTTRVSSTVTLGTSTVTEQRTSTAYVDTYGSTVALMKRQELSAEPSRIELYPRAIFTPLYFKGLRKTEIRAACLCLQIPTPVITRKMQTEATATVTQTLQRTLRTTTELPQPSRTVTRLVTTTIVVTAVPYPATATTWTVQEVRSCPPDAQTTYMCPSGTAVDDGSDPAVMNCGVTAPDGYSGACRYSNTDGSAEPSTLLLDDSVNEVQYSRAATYGSGDLDDCPISSAFICSASSAVNAKRSYLAAT